MEKTTLIASNGLAEVIVSKKDEDNYAADWHMIEKHWTPEPGEVCLDIGCGPGLWSLMALALRAECYSFDPKEEAIELLRKQIGLNGFSSKNLFNVGLWDR